MKFGVLLRLLPASLLLQLRRASLLFFHFVPNEDWWARRDLNPRPPACKAGALPTELSAHFLESTYKLVGARGFEPPTPGSQNQCANRTALRPEQGTQQKISTSQRQEFL